MAATAQTDSHAAAEAATGVTPGDVTVTVITSFTSDYGYGPMCADVNRRYAARHGYGFVCRVLPPTRQASQGRDPQWLKVLLLLELIDCLMHPEGTACPPAGCLPGTTHVLWLDADAVVLRHDAPAARLLAGLGDPHLVIGEDLTTASLLNTGVMLVRVSAWSQQLWHDVWASQSSLRFHHRVFHEQSGLIKQLHSRHEGLRSIQPFHSFAPGGPQGPKVFPHVAVLPRSAINTSEADLSSVGFVFHAAGNHRKMGGKMGALRFMLKASGLDQPCTPDQHPS